MQPGCVAKKKRREKDVTCHNCHMLAQTTYIMWPTKTFMWPEVPDVVHHAKFHLGPQFQLYDWSKSAIFLNFVLQLIQQVWAIAQLLIMWVTTSSNDHQFSKFFHRYKFLTHISSSNGTWIRLTSFTLMTVQSAHASIEQIDVTVNCF